MNRPAWLDQWDGYTRLGVSQQEELGEWAIRMEADRAQLLSIVKAIRCGYSNLIEFGILPRRYWPDAQGEIALCDSAIAAAERK